MSISMLMQRDDESKRLVQWVEGGAARNGRAASPPGAAARVLLQPHLLLQPHAPTTPPTHLHRRIAHFPAHCTSLPAAIARRRPSCPSCLLPPPAFPAGVADALERHYLRKVFFGFSRDREGKDLLEEVRRGALLACGCLPACWVLPVGGCWLLGAARAAPLSLGPLRVAAPTSTAAPTCSTQLSTSF